MSVLDACLDNIVSFQIECKKCSDFAETTDTDIAFAEIETKVNDACDCPSIRVPVDE